MQGGIKEGHSNDFFIVTAYLDGRWVQSSSRTIPRMLVVLRRGVITTGGLFFFISQEIKYGVPQGTILEPPLLQYNK